MRCLHLANMFFVVSDSSSVKTVRFLHVVSCAQGTFLIIDSPPPPPEWICPFLHSGSLCKLGQLTAKAALTQARRALLQSWEGQKAFFPPSFLFFASKVGMMTEDAAMTEKEKGPWVVRRSFWVLVARGWLLTDKLLPKALTGKGDECRIDFERLQVLDSSNFRCCKCWSVDVVLNMDLFVHLKLNLLFSIYIDIFFFFLFQSLEWTEPL